MMPDTVVLVERYERLLAARDDDPVACVAGVFALLLAEALGIDPDTAAELCAVPAARHLDGLLALDRVRRGAALCRFAEDCEMAAESLFGRERLRGLDVWPLLNLAAGYLYAPDDGAPPEPAPDTGVSEWVLP